MVGRSEQPRRDLYDKRGNQTRNNSETWRNWAAAEWTTMRRIPRVTPHIASFLVSAWFVGPALSSVTVATSPPLARATCAVLSCMLARPAGNNLESSRQPSSRIPSLRGQLRQCCFFKRMTSPCLFLLPYASMPRPMLSRHACRACALPQRPVRLRRGTVGHEGTKGAWQKAAAEGLEQALRGGGQEASAAHTKGTHRAQNTAQRKNRRDCTEPSHGAGQQRRGCGCVGSSDLEQSTVTSGTNQRKQSKRGTAPH
jgi:hypothetical protein